eukprot:GEZU01014267.1.p1 GENE.GEZU01014267.1~~GEZU01014267.1.p1  ORF type:complete len:676 (-),score=124.83 GEZU01014267.1:97-2124(-)
MYSYNNFSNYGSGGYPVVDVYQDQSQFYGAQGYYQPSMQFQQQNDNRISIGTDLYASNLGVTAPQQQYMDPLQQQPQQQCNSAMNQYSDTHLSATFQPQPMHQQQESFTVAPIVPPSPAMSSVSNSSMFGGGQPAYSGMVPVPGSLSALQPQAPQPQYNWIQNFWYNGGGGLNMWGNHHMESVPEGFEVRYTKAGMPYLIEKDAISDDSEEEKPKLWSSMTKIYNYYGQGIWLYFDFIKAIIILNFLLFVIQGIFFVIHIAKNHLAIREMISEGRYKDTFSLVLFSGNFMPNMKNLWIIVNTFCIAAMFLFGPIYWGRVTLLFNKRQELDTEGHIRSDADLIEANQDVGRIKKAFLFVFTYSIFIFLILVQGTVIGILSFIQYRSDLIPSMAHLDLENKDKVAFYALSVAISIAVSATNVVWAKICGKLTNIEKHRTWTGFRKHNAFKLIMFKIINVFTMGVVKGMLIDSCALSVFGMQYFILIIVDLFAFNAIEIATPLFQLKVLPRIHAFFARVWPSAGSCIKLKIKIEDLKDSQPEFDLTTEYLELIYRQYVIFCALPVFPLITFISFIGSIVEYVLDKFRLTHLCKRPPRTKGSMKSLIGFFMFMAAFFTLANWSSGTLYFLIGRYWCLYSESVFGSQSVFTTPQSFCQHNWGQCNIFNNQQTFTPVGVHW